MQIGAKCILKLFRSDLGAPTLFSRPISSTQSKVTADLNSERSRPGVERLPRRRWSSSWVKNARKGCHLKTTRGMLLNPKHDLEDI